MSRISPSGPRGRCAPTAAMALIAGALCVGSIGCGGGAPAPDYNSLNAEQYGLITENEFRSPLVEPRSTFSSDVNTASY